MGNWPIGSRVRQGKVLLTFTRAGCTAFSVTFSVTTFTASEHAHSRCPCTSWNLCTQRRWPESATAAEAARGARDEDETGETPLPLAPPPPPPLWQQQQQKQSKTPQYAVSSLLTAASPWPGGGGRSSTRHRSRGFRCCRCCPESRVRERARWKACASRPCVSVGNYYYTCGLRQLEGSLTLTLLPRLLPHLARAAPRAPSAPPAPPSDRPPRSALPSGSQPPSAAPA